MPRYAITDIHGCSRTFRFLVEDIIGLTADDELFLLGDYVDRGPDTKGVIDFILDLRAQGFAVRTLSGNHEAMMLSAREKPVDLPLWYRNGGAETLASFAVQTLEEVPARYWTFLEQLEYYIDLPDYLLVHAGFNFAEGRPFEDQHAMLWIRNFAVDHALLGGRVIVHGHTPTPHTTILADLNTPGRVVFNLDGGCVYPAPGLGHLTALNLDSRQLYVFPNLDWPSLLPG